MTRLRICSVECIGCRIYGAKTTRKIQKKMVQDVEGVYEKVDVIFKDTLNEQEPSIAIS